MCFRTHNSLAATEMFQGSLVLHGMCNSLNVAGTHKLIERGTTRRCGFLGLGMAFLEDVGHCRGRLCGFFGSSFPQ